MKEVILSKIESIERCILRIKEKQAKNDYDLNNYDIQDIIILNLQRACQMSIDLAMFINAELKYGIPKDGVESFKKLFDNGIITENVFLTMKKMTGFRNIAVHQYQKIDNKILEKIIESHLEDFEKFNSEIIEKLI